MSPRTLDRKRQNVSGGTALEESPRPSEIQSADEASSEPDVREIRAALGLSREDFARLTGFSARAIANWEAGQAPSCPSHQRMLEMAALQRELTAIAEPGEIGPWLLRPNEAFGGLKPLEVVERGEIHRIWQMLFWLQSGAGS